MERPRSSARSSSGAVEMRLRIWLRAWVRFPLAERRATRNTRMASTFPSLVLADPVASPPWAARAAATASSGIGLPRPPAALAVGPVDLDDGDLVGKQVTGQSGPIAAGPFDADELNGPEAPRAKPAGPDSRLGGGRKALDAELSLPVRRGQPPRGCRGVCRPLR